MHSRQVTSLDSKSSKALVVGGGINGIINAIFLAENGYRVKILENSSLVGGQFRGLSIGSMSCDKALYIPQLTGIKSVDKILEESCPVNLRYGVKKDIAGHILGGSHSEMTQFPDLRQILNNNELNNILNELFNTTRLNCSPVVPRSDLSLHNYFASKFGNILTDQLFEPICQKFWRLGSKEISSNALKVVHLQRVVAYCLDKSTELKKLSPYFDELLSFPDQLNVPAEFLANKTPSIYPKRYGLHHLLNGLLNRCQELDVDILTNINVLSSNISSSKISSLHCSSDKQSFDLNCDLVVWCAGVMSMSKLLNLPLQGTIHHQPINHSTVYIVCNKKPNVDYAYWSWDYDSNDFIRVSFPFNYASMPDFKSRYLILVEMHEPEINSSSISRQLVINYLASRNIVDTTSVVDVIFSQDSQRKFFIPSLDNLSVQETLLNSIESCAPANLVHASNKISRNIFYLDDLLKDAHHTLLEWM